MKTHELKCHPAYFLELKIGVKTFELRKNDRDFEAGDTLHLREYDPMKQEYTKSEPQSFVVTHMLEAPAFKALKKGWCIMSIKPT